MENLFLVSFAAVTFEAFATVTGACSTYFNWLKQWGVFGR